MHKHRFINNLSSDILKQNHHLKGELINLRKTLKEYENKMLAELQSAAKMINLDIDFLTFESASQSLEGFIRVLHQALLKVHIISTSLTKKQQEHVITTSQLKQNYDKLQDKRNQINQLKQMLSAMQRNKCGLQQQIRVLTENYDQEQFVLVQQITKLKLQLDSLDSNLNLKYMLEKKIVTDKAHRQLVQYRQNAQQKYTLHQKQLRSQLDKKDKELKALLNTITNIFGPKIKKKQGSNQIEEYQEASQPTPAQIKLLEKIIKPFTKYTQLNDKISQLRNQLSESQQSNRNLSTVMIVVENKQVQIKNDNQILQSKISILQYKYDDLQKKFDQIFSDNQKLKTDMRTMENYYEIRWDNQFRAVRQNLQKKYNKKIVDCDDQHKQSMRALEMQKQQIAIFVQRMKTKIDILEKRNDYLQSQSIERQTLISSLQQKMTILRQQARESQQMHNQEVCTYKYQLGLIINDHKQKINNLRNDILKLKQTLQNTINFHEEQINRLDKQNLHNIINLKEELKQYYEKIVADRQQTVDKLSRQLSAHKLAIQNLHRSSFIQIQREKGKWQKDKELQLRNQKIQYYEQNAKLSEKILKLSLHLSQMKTKLENQIQDSNRQIFRYEKNIKQKNSEITEAKKQTKKKQKQIAEVQKVVTAKLQQIKKLQYKQKSLEVLISSRQLQINNLNQQLKQFVLSRKNWKRDVTNLKKDYETKFKQLKQIFDRRVSFYKSRMWQLQRISDAGIINGRQIQKIRSLTEQKQKLQDKISMKQAENLVLNQVKKYYENKSRQSDSRLTLKFQLKDLRESKQPIFVKRPRGKSRKSKLRGLNTQQSGDLNVEQYTNSDWYSTQRQKKEHRTKYESQDNFYEEEKTQREKNVQSTILNIKNNMNSKPPTNLVMHPTVITDHQVNGEHYSNRNPSKNRAVSSVM